MRFLACALSLAAAVLPASALRVGLAPACRRRERFNACMAAPAAVEEGDKTPEEDDNNVGRRIFCNRALNMNQIQAVGFDLDYTLAEYIPETFDLLAYDGERSPCSHARVPPSASRARRRTTWRDRAPCPSDSRARRLPAAGAVRKLLAMGYPDEIASFEYDPNKYQRGLVIDKRRGNLLKLDRHKYVKVAYHGLGKLDPELRKAMYAQQYENMPTFTPPEYASVDTEFLLVDVALFCQLVDLKDTLGDAVPQSYAKIYSDVRRAVDLCHCDGEIKDPVAVEPSR